MMLSWNSTRCKDAMGSTDSQQGLILLVVITIDLWKSYDEAPRRVSAK